MRFVRVALVQLSSGLDREENRRRAVEAVRAAGGRGAALLVLPEATMCGFGRTTTPLGPLAEPLDGPFVGALADAAADTGTTVVAGTFEPVAGEDRVYNTVVVVGPQGLAASYRKIHLYDALGWCESARIKAAEVPELVVVPVADLVLGVLTCYDLRFPELARALVERGATVLAVPAAWVSGPGKADQWTTLLRARAIENVAYVVAADQSAPEYTGCSAVVAPDGQVLGALGERAQGTPEGLVVVELDADRIARARVALPVLDHRRFGVYPLGAGTGDAGRRGHRPGAPS